MYHPFKSVESHNHWRINMKKIALTTLFLLMSAASSTVLADQVNPLSKGGFEGPGVQHALTTVREALNSSKFSDDVRVKLTGFVINSLGDDKYTFRDETGEITVEIDNDKWFGLKATPTVKVIIDGEIDNEFIGKEIDVDRIRTM